MQNKEGANFDEVLIAYFVHGTTTDNEQGLATGWLPGELSETGRAQAIKLGEQAADKHFDVVFCSDLQRAVDSARLGFGGKYEIIQDERLRECNYGDLNGTPTAGFKSDMTQYVKKPFPHGESYEDVAGRIQDFRRDIAKKYTGKHIAIVAHQAPQLALEHIANGKTWERVFAEDWRKTGAWQPGWTYRLKIYR
ncbi:histidine phosphatase family protein [Candidatus Saccharibacteria bacterium]|nr:histidine phosphatase family protein [Candidatus Saccharibacteria bacterium]